MLFLSSYLAHYPSVSLRLPRTFCASSPLHHPMSPGISEKKPRWLRGKSSPGARSGCSCRCRQQARLPADLRGCTSGAWPLQLPPGQSERGDLRCATAAGSRGLHGGLPALHRNPGVLHPPPSHPTPPPPPSLPPSRSALLQDLPLTHLLAGRCKERTGGGTHNEAGFQSTAVHNQRQLPTP